MVKVKSRERTQPGDAAIYSGSVTPPNFVQRKTYKQSGYYSTGIHSKE